MLADKVTLNNQEHLAVCVLFVDSSQNIREEFSGLYLQRTAGKDIAGTIMAALQAHDLPLSNIRGQGYDGAAEMSSNTVGVQARLRQESPLAVYTQCSGHCVIAHSCAIMSICNIIIIIKVLFQTQYKVHSKTHILKVIQLRQPASTKCRQ